MLSLNSLSNAKEMTKIKLYKDKFIFQSQFSMSFETKSMSMNMNDGNCFEMISFF